MRANIWKIRWLQIRGLLALAASLNDLKGLLMGFDLLDPYALAPFSAYPDMAEASFVPEVYPTLMHFIESEKYRGVDDSYRRFINRIESIEDFKLETMCAPPELRRQDWEQVRSSLIRAAVWMQLTTHKSSALGEQYLRTDDLTGVDLIDDEIRSVRTALFREEPMRRVLFCGAPEVSDEQAVNRVIDDIFTNRQPDEIIVFAEPGVARIAANYAAARYIPIQVHTPGPAMAEAIRATSHLFLLTADGQATEASHMAVAAAKESGKVVHEFDLAPACAED